MVEHRFLQQISQRQFNVDVGKQGDIEQRQRTIKENAQRDTQKMAGLGAALAEKQIA